MKPRIAPPPRRASVRRYIPCVLALVVGSVLSVFLFVRVRGWEQDRARGQFERQAAVLSGAMTRSLDAHLDALRVVEAFVPVVDPAAAFDPSDPSVDVFRVFARRMFIRYPGIESLQWLPRVPADQREVYESFFRAAGHPDFQFTEPTEAGPMPAAQRAEYILVLFTQTAEGGAAVPGLDLAADPARREMFNRARDTGSMILWRLRPEDGLGDRDGFLVALPLYHPGTPRDTVEERRAGLVGYLATVLRIDQFVNAVVAGEDAEAIGIRISEAGVDGDGRSAILYDSPGPAANGHAADEDTIRGGPHAITMLDVAGHRWAALFYPLPGSIDSHSWSSRSALAGGLLFTAMLAYYLFSLASRAVARERTEAERRARLIAANEVLQHEVAERRHVEAALRQSEHQYRSVVEQVKEVIFQFDATGRLTFLNPAWTELTGYTVDESIGTRYLAYVHSDDRRRLRELTRSVIERRESYFQQEVRSLTKAGATRWADVNARVLVDEHGAVTSVFGTLTDITDRKRFEEQLSYQAFHDGLTGLPNRALFTNRLTHALARAEAAHTSLAVLFLDVDAFKVINDSLGHGAGDEVLLAVGRRLRGSARAGDTVARFGGDEFTALVEDLTDPVQVLAAAERMLEALRQPILCEGCEVVVTASIGIAMSTPAAPVPPEDLMRRADTALYQAKAAGKARAVIFDPHMDALLVARLDLESDLRRAIGRNELRVHYQPEVDLETGEVVGMEALVRWQHPGHGLMPPAEFIPLAEETGLIIPIGRWVLEEACRQVRTWHLAHPDRPPARLSINLSARQFGQPDLAQQVARVLEATGLDPACLTLEITESAFMREGDAPITTLHALKKLGVRLALDDFGTGYSSLSYLRRFPVDRLKVDRSFVHELDHDGGAGAIVEAITTLAHALGMEVTAEGIETAAQLARIRTVQCDVGQGFYFAPPLPADAMAGILQSGITPEPDPRAVRAG